MAIPVTCQCRRKFKAPEKFAGKRVKCPSCASVIVVPGADEAPIDRGETSTPPAPEKPSAVDPSFEAFTDSNRYQLGNPNLEDVRFICPHCGGAFAINACMAGLPIRCNGCQGALVVPFPKKDRNFRINGRTTVTPGACFSRQPKSVRFAFEDTDKSLDMQLKLLSLDKSLHDLTGESPLFKETSSGNVTTTSMPNPRAFNPVVWPPYCVACGAARPEKTFSHHHVDTYTNATTTISTPFRIEGVPACDTCGEEKAGRCVWIGSSSAIFSNGGYAQQFARANAAELRELSAHELEAGEVWGSVGCFTIVGALVAGGIIGAATKSIMGAALAGVAVGAAVGSVTLFLTRPTVATEYK